MDATTLTGPRPSRQGDDLDGNMIFRYPRAMSELMSNPSLKLITSTVMRIDAPDDPSLPYRLVAYMRDAAPSQLSGHDQLVMRGATEKDLLDYVERNGFRSLKHLSSFKITGPDGRVIEHFRNGVATA